MPRLSEKGHFLQSPSFRQAQSALIGQLAQYIVIGRTPQARVRNVTTLTIIASFSCDVAVSPSLTHTRVHTQVHTHAACKTPHLNSQ